MQKKVIAAVLDDDTIRDLDWFSQVMRWSRSQSVRYMIADYLAHVKTESDAIKSVHDHINNI